MLSFKNDMNDDKTTRESIENNISISEIETDIDSMNLKLFPEFGPLKILKNEERQEKINRFQESYKETEEKISELKTSINKEIKNNSISYSDVGDFHNKFNLSAVQFEMDASVLSQRKCNFRKSEFYFDYDKDLLKNTDKNIDSALKVLS